MHPALTQYIAYNQATAHDKSKTLHSPYPAYLLQQWIEYHGEYDAAQSCAEHGNSRSHAMISLKPVPNDFLCHGDDNCAGQSPQETQAEYEMPILSASGQDEEGYEVARGPCSEQIARTVLIKQNTSVNNEDERREDKQRRNPRDFGGCVCG